MQLLQNQYFVFKTNYSIRIKMLLKRCAVGWLVDFSWLILKLTKDLSFGGPDVIMQC